MENREVRDALIQSFGHVELHGNQLIVIYSHWCTHIYVKSEHIVL